MSYLLCLAANQVSGFVLSFSLLYFLFSFLPLVNLIILFSNNPVLLLHEHCVDFQFCSNPFSLKSPFGFCSVFFVTFLIYCIFSFFFPDVFLLIGCCVRHIHLKRHVGLTLFTFFKKCFYLMIVETFEVK